LNIVINYTLLNQKTTIYTKILKIIQKGPGIALQRLGGLSPVNQNDAPEKKGIWAFVFPFYSPFLTSSTDEIGVIGNENYGKRLSRHAKLKKYSKTNPSLN
jgi:hypothetical protein